MIRNTYKQGKNTGEINRIDMPGKIFSTFCFDMYLTELLIYGFNYFRDFCSFVAEFNSPEYIAIDSEDNLIIVDGGSNDMIRNE